MLCRRKLAFAVIMAMFLCMLSGTVYAGGFEITDLTAVHDFAENRVLVSGICYIPNKTVTVLVTKEEVDLSVIGPESIDETIIGIWEMPIAERTFEFALPMPASALATGTYKVHVCEKGMLEPQTINFAYSNPIEFLGQVLESMNGATADTLIACIRSHALYLGINISDLSEPWFEEKAVAGLFMQAKPSSGFTTLKEVRNAFMGAVALSRMNAAEPEEIIRLLELYLTELQVDQEQYQSFAALVVGKTEEERQKKQDDLKKLVGERLSLKEYQNTIEFNRELDQCLALVDISNAESWGSLQTMILEQYQSQLNLSAGICEKYELLNVTKQGNVWKQLFGNEYEEIQKIAQAFADAVHFQEKASDGLGGTGGVGGGPSGGRTTELMGPGKTAQAKPPEIEPEPETPVFLDMDQAEWARDSVETLAGKGIITGFAGSYRPNEPITREEFVKLITQVFEIYDPAAVTSFSDVLPGAWYYGYVASAAERGIVRGIGENRFGVGENILRQDVAVMVYQALQELDISISLDVPPALFSDADAISDYAKDGVVYLQGAGIMNGMGDNRFSPQAHTTRAEAAQLLCKLLAKVGL